MVNQEGRSSIGSWEGMVDTGLPCPSNPMRDDTLGVPHHFVARKAVKAVCFSLSHRAPCDCHLQFVSLFQLQWDSLGCQRHFL